MRHFPLCIPTRHSNGSPSFSPETAGAPIPLVMRWPGYYLHEPEDIPCRTHTSSGKDSRLWWNLETFLSLDFGPGTPTWCAWRLVDIPIIRPNCHLIRWQFGLMVSISTNRQAHRVRFLGPKSRDKNVSRFHHCGVFCCIKESGLLRVLIIKNLLQGLIILWCI